MTLTTTTERQTFAIGKKIARLMRGGEVLCLSGDLGSGKTVLVKGIAAGLGIRTPLTSPTFVIFKPYPVRQRGNITTFVHADLYRLSYSTAIAATGLTEYLGQAQTVTAIEWADRLPLPTKASFPVWRIHLHSGKNPRHRKITITGLPRQK